MPFLPPNQQCQSTVVCIIRCKCVDFFVNRLNKSVECKELLGLESVGLVIRISRCR